jgi:hypothetical protein
MPTRTGELPDISYGGTIVRPAPVPSGAGAGTIFSQIADAADAVGAHFECRAVSDAEQLGAEEGARLARGEIERDADGNLQLNRPILRSADDAYMQAAKLA